MHRYATPLLTFAIVAVVVALIYIAWPRKEAYYETAPQLNMYGQPMYPSAEGYNYNYNTDDYYSEKRAYIPQ